MLSAVINHPEDRCRPFDDTYDTTLRLAGCVFVFAAVRTLMESLIGGSLDEDEDES